MLLLLAPLQRVARSPARHFDLWHGEVTWLRSCREPTWPQIAAQRVLDSQHAYAQWCASVGAGREDYWAAARFPLPVRPADYMD